MKTSPAQPHSPEDLKEKPLVEEAGYQKIIQFKAPEKGSLQKLAQDYLDKNYSCYTVFAKEALQSPAVVAYVSEKKVPLSYIVKAKAPIVLLVQPKSHNLATKTLAEESIQFREKGLIIVSKPPGLPTQSTFKAWEDNLFQQILLRKIMEKNFPQKLPYLGLHHRLDRDTSGLVLMTEKPSCNKEVADLFRLRKIKKRYEALVQGIPKGDSWKNTSEIAKVKHPRYKFFFKAVPSGGEAAETHFKVLEKIDGDHYLLQCSPKTGRTHQIRVHLLDNGLRLLGDHVYGVLGKEKPMKLHAAQLDFVFQDQKISVHAPKPW